MVRDLHEDLPGVFVGGLVLSHRLPFSLVFVMRDHPLYTLFVLYKWKPILPYHDIFLPRRRLNALGDSPITTDS
jgi:hypothetical protein